MVSLPSAKAPSHESAPVYAVARVPSARLEALPVTVCEQIGVGSPEAPAAKNIVTLIVVPETVPENVPVLLRWQELHEPSVGSTACVATVPETVFPVWVSPQVTVVTPFESTPVPFHVPVRFAGADAAGGVADGATAAVGETPPHETVSAARTVAATCSLRSAAAVFTNLRVTRRTREVVRVRLASSCAPSCIVAPAPNAAAASRNPSVTVTTDRLRTTRT
jgi:hypothetical protein